MSTLAMKNESVEPAAIRAWAEKRTIYIELTDERIIGFPDSCFILLATAPEEKLKEVALRLNGYALLCAWNLLMKHHCSRNRRRQFSIALSHRIGSQSPAGL